jgi:UDP-N-acetylmuramoyl-tripeptide--D-alanyl-D-alanine ligase
MIDILYHLYTLHPNVVTDSRKITKDCLFFALKGDNFNGNQYAEAALKQGASFAIIDDLQYKSSENCLVVKDVLTTLQNLARHHRRQFDIPVIAITGSNGKTTTKELMASVMESHYPTHYTKGNLNNHIGVPLTLLSMTHNAEVAIIEMGANHQLEIDALCHIAEPTHGLITNIGKAHLEGFGGFEGVIKGKSEMYKYLNSHKGTVFVNLDEPILADLSKDIVRKIRYKSSEDLRMTHPEIEAKLTANEPFLVVDFLSETGEVVTVNTQLIGEYNFNNIMTAIAVGKYFKVPASKIKTSLEQYIPANNRSQVMEYKGAKLILDAYNANPSSMRLALLNLSNIHATNKVAILGEMRELGQESEKEHQEIFDLAQSLGFDTLVTIGTQFGKADKSTHHFDTTPSAKIWFDTQSFEGHTLLIKGSRGMQLETLING